MTESTVFADSFAAETKQARSKEEQWSECSHSDHRRQNDCRYFVGHHMSPVMKNVLAPGCSDHASDDERDRCESLYHETQETDPSMSVRVRCDDPQMSFRKFEGEVCPQQPAPKRYS